MITDSERTHNNSCTSFNTLVQYGGNVTGWDFQDFDIQNDITDNSHRLAARIGSMINRLGGEEASVV